MAGRLVWICRLTRLRMRVQLNVTSVMTRGCHKTLSHAWLPSCFVPLLAFTPLCFSLLSLWVIVSIIRVPSVATFSSVSFLFFLSLFFLFFFSSFCSSSVGVPLGLRGCKVYSFELYFFSFFFYGFLRLRLIQRINLLHIFTRFIRSNW